MIKYFSPLLIGLVLTPFAYLFSVRMRRVEVGKRNKIYLFILVVLASFTVFWNFFFADWILSRFFSTEL